MITRKLILLLVAAMVITGASYVVRNAASGSTVADGNANDMDPMALPRGKTIDELVDFWGGRFERDPRDFISLTYLGLTFMQKARETGDVGDYERAEAALRKALGLDPKYQLALGYLSAALFAKHDFQSALNLASNVYASNPGALQTLGTIGDAQLELGNYAAAETAYRKLMAAAPSPPVYTRLARLAWLKGNRQEALDLMRRTAEEAATAGYSGEEAAWYEYQLGELYFNTAQYEQAAKHYTRALGYFDRYYLGLAGMGKVRAAEGHYEQAIAFYRRAVEIIPQPDLLAALGDLYALTGQTDKAQKQYDTVEFIGKLAAINKVIYNRQLALFEANHDIKPQDALDLASKELANRKDVYGYDAEAWALYKNGRYQEAEAAMTQAMKLGTRDALFYYHSGMIYKALGKPDRAQAMLKEAMSLNPHFDLLQARIAHAALGELASE